MPGTPALKRLTVLACVQLACSAGYISYFSAAFDYGERLIIVHICTIAALLAIGTILLGLFAHVFRWPTAHVALSLLPACAFAGVVLLYAADLVSNRFWSHNLTYDLVLRYLLRPAVVAAYVGTGGSWLIVTMVVAIAMVGALYIAISGVVIRGAADLFTPSPANRRHRLALLLLSGAAVLCVAGVIGLAATISPSARWALFARDPVLGFFADENSAREFAYSRLATRFQAEGTAARSQYPRGQRFDRRNVVMIVVDSLRPDHMQLYGYGRPTTPFLDSLRQTGHLQQVELALATCPESVCGISSILSSKTFGSLVRHNFKLHELLSDQGYGVNFILSGDHDWLGLKEFYGDSLTLYFDGMASRQHEPSDDRVVFEGLERVPAFTGTPAFFYFHLMATHMLFAERQEHFLVYQPTKTRGSVDLYRSELDVIVNSYDNGVLQADGMIQKLFETLGRKRYLDNALVVVLGDHGEGLGDRATRGFGHGGSLHQEFLRIPMLIYDTERVPYLNLRFATQVDVAPTIVDRLGLAIPSSWEGSSLLRPRTHAHSYHHIGNSYAVVHPTSDAVYKYLRHSRREELFELTSDPGERHSRLSADVAITRQLRQRLDETLASLER